MCIGSALLFGFGLVERSLWYEGFSEEVQVFVDSFRADGLGDEWNGMEWNGCL